MSNLSLWLITILVVSGFYGVVVLIVWLLLRNLIKELKLSKLQFLSIQVISYFVCMLGLACSIKFTFWVSFLIDICVSIIVTIAVCMVGLKLRGKSDNEEVK